MMYIVYFRQLERHLELCRVICIHLQPVPLWRCNEIVGPRLLRATSSLHDGFDDGGREYGVGTSASLMRQDNSSASDLAAHLVRDVLQISHYMSQTKNEKRMV